MFFQISEEDFYELFSKTLCQDLDLDTIKLETQADTNTADYLKQTLQPILYRITYGAMEYVENEHNKHLAAKYVNALMTKLDVKNRQLL